MPSNTITSGTPVEARVVTYEVPGVETVRLNYTSMKYSVSYQNIGRQQIRRIYTFTFRFIVSGNSSEELRRLLTVCERVLSTRGGTLTVADNATLFKAAPATASPMISATLWGRDSRTREVILADIDWGPRPISLENESPIFSIGTTLLWSVQVSTAAEDAYLYRDICVLGVDTEIMYGIDQNHYTTRNVTGKVYLANFGRLGSTFSKSNLSQADAMALRTAIISNQGGQSTFMEGITIPPNFIRLTEIWGVDNTENCLTFTIVDREVYRLYPAYITDCSATMTVSVVSVSALQWVSHTLQGQMSAPRDVSKLRVLESIWEVIQQTMPFITRMTDNTAFVKSMQFTNDIYSNRIAYHVLAYTPFGSFNLCKSMGMGPIVSEVFPPQGPGGSANIYGSGYRTLGGKFLRIAPLATGEKEDPREVEAAVFSGIDTSRGFGKKLLAFNAQAIPIVITKTHFAVCIGSGGIRAYSVGPSDITFQLRVETKQIVGNKEKKVDYMLDTLKTLAKNPDILIYWGAANPGTVEVSPLNNSIAIQDSFSLHIKIIGETAKKIEAQFKSESGSHSMSFISWMNAKFSMGEIDNLSKLLAPYLSGTVTS